MPSLLGLNDFHGFHMSVDRTDCIVEKLAQFMSIWYSRKHHDPVLQFEIGLAKFEERITLVHGSFPYEGIFRSIYFSLRLRGHLENGKRVVSYGGYGRDMTFQKGIVVPGSTDMFKIIGIRHECLNGRLKTFRVLSSHFRH